MFAAMRRSRDLAKGSLWPLMAVWLLIFVAFIALSLVPDELAFLSDTTLGPSSMRWPYTLSLLPAQP